MDVKQKDRYFRETIHFQNTLCISIYIYIYIFFFISIIDLTLLRYGYDTSEMHIV